MSESHHKKSGKYSAYFFYSGVLLFYMIITQIYWYTAIKYDINYQCTSKLEMDLINIHINCINLLVQCFVKLTNETECYI